MGRKGLTQLQVVVRDVVTVLVDEKTFISHNPLEFPKGCGIAANRWGSNVRQRGSQGVGVELEGLSDAPHCNVQLDSNKLSIATFGPYWHTLLGYRVHRGHH